MGGLKQKCGAESKLLADGGTTWVDLSGFQRDILEAIAHIETTGEESYGLAIEEELEQRYRDVLRSRLYQNLDSLIDLGLVERTKLNGRTNSYTLTAEAVRMLEESIHRRATACGLHVDITPKGDKVSELPNRN